jgi:hypothetical protein
VLLRVGWLVAANLDVPVARNHCTALLLRPIGGADLYQLRLGCDGLPNVRVQLRGPPSHLMTFTDLVVYSEGVFHGPILG